MPSKSSKENFNAEDVKPLVLLIPFSLGANPSYALSVQQPLCAPRAQAKNSTYEHRAGLSTTTYPLRNHILQVLALCRIVAGTWT